MIVGGCGSRGSCSAHLAAAVLAASGSESTQFQDACVLSGVVMCITCVMIDVAVQIKSRILTWKRVRGRNTWSPKRRWMRSPSKCARECSRLLPAVSTTLGAYAERHVSLAFTRRNVFWFQAGLYIYAHVHAEDVMSCKRDTEQCIGAPPSAVARNLFWKQAVCCQMHPCFAELLPLRTPV